MRLRVVNRTYERRRPVTFTLELKDMHMMLDEAVEKANQLALSLHGLRLKSDLRSRAAAACFAVAQQHHNAILILVGNQPPLYASAFALFRLLVEATIRGHWLSHCASDEQVSNFVEPQRQQLDTASMMKAIDNKVALVGDTWSSHKSIYEKHWSALSAYTHTGDLQIQHWLTTKDIEANYPVDGVSELLCLANSVAMLAASGAQALEIGTSNEF